MKVYAICLEREPERRRLLMGNLSSLGIEPVIVGIDGEKLTSDHAAYYSESEAIKRWGRGLTKGEIGVYLSHITIWKKIASASHEFSLILESDADLTREALDIIDVISTQHSDADMVMLSYADCVPSVWGQRKLLEKYRLVSFTRKTHFSSAYLVSRHGAQELLRHSQFIVMPVDEMMVGKQIEKDMSIYAVYPRPVYLIQQAFETSVLKSERADVTGNQNKQAEKPKKYGLKRLEQIIRHFFISLKPPRKV